MPRRGKAEHDVLGKRGLTHFDYCVIGSGAGGATAAHVLTAAKKKVLVLEAGPNPYPGLEHPRLRFPLHGNDELKYAVRGWIGPDEFADPRVFRMSALKAGTPDPGTLLGDVNSLPKAVGGAFQHADCKTPRFNAVDFQLKTKMEALLAANPDLTVPGFGADAASANFADWPFTYDDLEPFYLEAELLYGVQGRADDNPFASPRSAPYPMPPGVPMYLALRLAEGARAVQLGDQGFLSPHTYPGAINSRFYGGRPPCVDCGLCSGFGCPNNSKGSPPVTALRRALLTGHCQLRYNAAAVRLVNDGGHVSAVEYIDADGERQTATASAFILAASPIESARLCFLSGPSPTEPLGNRSGQVGQNLMCHLQTLVNGFLPERVHGQRGRAVTHGLSDFRGVVPGGADIRIVKVDNVRHVAMGGICEFGGSQGLPITEDGDVYSLRLPGASGARFGTALKNALRDQALGQHLVGITMQAEDAPQRTNAVDLDLRYRDVYGLPVARVTYGSHPYELEARKFYRPYMTDILRQAGALSDRIFVAPCNVTLGMPPDSRHIMGTLRMGKDPTTSVTDATGRFHDVDNLFAADGSVFPTASGYNPTLTIIAVALRIAHGLAGTPPDLRIEVPE